MAQHPDSDSFTVLFAVKLSLLFMPDFMLHCLQSVRWRWKMGRSQSSCPSNPQVTSPMTSEWSGGEMTLNQWWWSTCIRTNQISLTNRTRSTEAEQRRAKSCWRQETSAWPLNIQQSVTREDTAAESTAGTSGERRPCCSKSEVSMKVDISSPFHLHVLVTL